MGSLRFRFDHYPVQKGEELKKLSVMLESIFDLVRNPVNVAMGLTAFAHGLIGILEPKPSFGNTSGQMWHATRHIEAKGLNVRAIKAAIIKALKPDPSYTSGVTITGTIIVSGVEVSYSGVKLPNGKINIG